MAILGPNGRPLVMRPDTREIAVASVRDKWSTYPSSGLTPQRLATIFREADQGDVYRQAELFEEIEEKDAHLSSIMGTRKSAVQGLDWEVMPLSDDPQDVEVAKFVGEVLDSIPGLKDAFLDLLDAIGKGFAVSEIMWSIQTGKAIVSELKWRHQKRFRFGDRDELRLLTPENMALGEELPSNKFVVHKYKGRSGSPARAGILRVVTWMYLFKNYTLKDWVSFAEVYGMPLRLGKYDASTSPEDREALIKAVSQLGTDAAGVISKSTEIEFIESVKTTSADLYDRLVEFCNREMSKAVLGQTLTTEVGKTGSFAASKTHDGVRHDLVEADSEALAETLRRDLIRPIVLFNFGYTNRLPWLKFHHELPEDLEKAANTYETLVRMGLPIAAEHVYQKFGIPAPEPGQKILIPPGAMPPIPIAAKHPVKLLRLANSGPPSSQELQRQNDALADQAIELSLPIFRRLAEPVQQLIQEATSLEDLQERLARVYKEMATDDLEDLIARATFAADLYGRWAVDQGGD